MVWHSASFTVFGSISSFFFLSSFSWQVAMWASNPRRAYASKELASQKQNACPQYSNLLAAKCNLQCIAFYSRSYFHNFYLIRIFPCNTIQISYYCFVLIIVMAIFLEQFCHKALVTVLKQLHLRTI